MTAIHRGITASLRIESAASSLPCARTAFYDRLQYVVCIIRTSGWLRVKNKSVGSEEGVQ